MSNTGCERFLTTLSKVNKDKDIDDEILVLAIQQQSLKNNQLSCSCQDYDGSKVHCEPRPIMRAKGKDVELSTIADFVLAQSKDAFCAKMWPLIASTSYLFTFEKYRLLVR